jgi:hypothetical protein
MRASTRSKPPIWTFRQAGFLLKYLSPTVGGHPSRRRRPGSRPTTRLFDVLRRLNTRRRTADDATRSEARSKRQLSGLKPTIGAVAARATPASKLPVGRDHEPAALDKLRSDRRCARTIVDCANWLRGGEKRHCQWALNRLPPQSAARMKHKSSGADKTSHGASCILWELRFSCVISSLPIRSASLFYRCLLCF